VVALRVGTRHWSSTTAGDDAPTAARRQRRRWLVVAGVAYLAVSLALERRALQHPFSATAGSAAADAHFFVWWLRWTPWALLHGQNPLLTDYMNYPGGVNGVWNTSVLALGILAAPLTLTLGPIAAFNALLVLGPVVSGLLFFAVVGRYVQRPWTAVCCGLAYAFSPFAAAHLWASHLDLVWNILPPLLLLFLDEIFVRQRTRPWVLGGAFGLTLAVQAGLYSQTLVIGGVMFATAVVLLVLRWPAEVRRRAGYVATVGATALGTLALLYGFPLYLAWRGPSVPRKPAHGSGYYVADLANLVVPTKLTLLRLGTGDHAAQLRAHIGEQGLYVGVAALLAVVLATIVVRRPLARLIGLVGLASIVLALGPRLVVLGQERGVVLPWALLLHVPGFRYVESVRFELFTAFCVAVLLALWLDTAVAAGRWQLRAAGVVLGVIALVTLLPADAQVASPLQVPSFFRDGLVSAAVRQGAVVKTVPRPSARGRSGAVPMAWQAISGMHYRMTGGYFIGSDATHPVLLEGVPDAYDRVADAIRRGGRPPGSQAPETAAAAAALRRSNVALLVVTPVDGARTEALLGWSRVVTGRPSRQIGGVWVFDLS
jgi:hypothetical protein